MSLAAGTRLGPYEIQSAIGAGGMGEVYKARDTRLGRSVAIKILPLAVAADPDRRARFEREAKTVAALNHPHICSLHDVGEHDGSMFLVMEHVDGDTLSARLRKGPLPLDQALTVATQIADALAVAHRQGIVHRDLKPGNVMLTKSGAKLLDFGLAKLRDPTVAQAAVETATKTSDPVTEEGTVLGTVSYMAPEQLEGKQADARSDIFSFGAMLYEMVTGRRAFEGASRASVVAAVLDRHPPPPSSMQPLTPPAVDDLVRQCLAKSPDDRPDSAREVANELRWIREASGVSATQGGHRRRSKLIAALFVASGLAMAAAGAGLIWWLRPAPARTVPAHLSVDVRPAEEVNAGGVYPAFVSTAGGSRTAFAWTPDGQSLVFVGRRGAAQQLYVRQLEAAEARPLANTEGAQVPAVSADGQWVAFWANGAIRKAPLAGGPVVTVASGLADPPCGLAWDASGRLFYGTWNGPVWAVPPDGPASAVTTVDKANVAHVLPSLLPGGRTLLYTARKNASFWGGEEVVAQTLASGARKVLLREAADARYVPSGHLVFLRGGQLFAVPFDPERVEVRGAPVPVLADVAQATFEGSADADITGAGQFAISATGTLAWLPGPVVPTPDGVLVTVDRQGRITPLLAPARRYIGPVRVSRDGRRLAVTIWADRTNAKNYQTDSAVWVYDIDRGTLNLVAGGGQAMYPVWTPDGYRVAFDWNADGQPSVVARRADGSASIELLAVGRLSPSSFTPDGRQLIAVRNGQDIVSVTVANGQVTGAQPVVQTDSVEYSPDLSPDGRWLAFASNVSGRFEVYVRPYPGPGPAEPVSVEGGGSPVWRRDGHEVFFQTHRSSRDNRQRVMSVEFSPGAGPGDRPRIGRPRVLFEFDNDNVVLSCGQVRCYDVAPNGQRFYGVQSPPPPSPAATHISLILNWLEELEAKVPARR
jgi:Tol biopolymer transport system component